MSSPNEPFSPTPVVDDPQHMLPANPPRRDYVGPEDYNDLRDDRGREYERDYYGDRGRVGYYDDDSRDEEAGYGTYAAGGAAGLVGLALAGLGAYLAYRYYFQDDRQDYDYDVRGADGRRHRGRGHQGGRRFQGDRGPSPQELYDRGVHLHESVTVSRPRQDVYAYWRDLTNQPKFMPHIQNVTVEGDGGVGSKSHWTIEGPMGKNFEYDAETTADNDGSLISWRTVGSTPVQHAGTARFRDAPGGKGTEVHLEVQYLPPGGGTLGGFGDKLLSLVGQDPERDCRRGLRNFKRIMETGTLPTTEGQPRGNC